MTDRFPTHVYLSTHSDSDDFASIGYQDPVYGPVTVSPCSWADPDKALEFQKKADSVTVNNMNLKLVPMEQVLLEALNQIKHQGSDLVLIAGVEYPVTEKGSSVLKNLGVDVAKRRYAWKRLLDHFPRLSRKFAQAEFRATLQKANQLSVPSFFTSTPIAE